MEWCVCKIKATGEMFIQKRIDREMMLAALEGVEQINSIVIKVCATEKEAEEYIDDINLSNEILEKIL